MSTFISSITLYQKKIQPISKHWFYFLDLHLVRITCKTYFNLLVAHQHYKTGGSEEYIIRGNDAIIKCNIPSFVSDFVTVDSWVDSEGGEIFANNNIGNCVASVKFSYILIFPCI